MMEETIINLLIYLVAFAIMGYMCLDALRVSRRKGE